MSNTPKDEGNISEQYWSALDRVSRFLVLANSGAAVAVLSFLAQSLDTTEPLWFPVASLACFSIGLVSAGFSVLALFFELAADRTDMRAIKWPLKLSGDQRWRLYMTVSLFAFLAGVALGLVGLFVLFF